MFNFVCPIVRRTRFFVISVVMLAASMLMAGCATTGGSSSSGPLAGADREKLTYGISIMVPKDWKVTNSVSESKLPAKNIDETIASGGRTPLFEMKRLDESGKTTALAVIYIVNSKRDMMPEEAVAKATPDFFQQLAQNIMKTAQEESAKNKQPNNMLDWAVSAITVSGKTGVLQSGLGKRPGGTMRVLNADLYLPNNAGLVVKLMGYPEVAGTEELLLAILNSIEIAE